MTVSRFAGVFAAAFAWAAFSLPVPPSALAQSPGAVAAIPEAKLSLVPAPGYRRIPASQLPAAARQAVFAYVGPKSSGFASNINLMLQNAPPGLKADASSAEALGGQLKKSIPKYKKVGTGLLTVGGESAAFLSGAFTVQNHPVQNKQVIVVHNGKGYIFTFSAAQSAYAKDVVGFDKMIASIKWL